ncbi:DNA ligase D [Massilia terrae]|uniref:DNA ligase (ATP) n=1 Tax=Massilia terrae TaxID=1811224 RepID=A0ABT2CUP5_9BURK|nr:DNA ligase D [Massilia terrae]MCS0657706.1 DNA ligase D [Massilia terrae]
MADALKLYKAKRNFSITSEPAEGGKPCENGLSFVIQKHWATRLHYDFRLELDGSMKSWAVPKGPSYDTRDKRMAVHVEDHPISYNEFEGTIPEKQYGAGKVIIWDKGTWDPLEDPRKGFEKGSLKFEMHGHKMHGKWALVRIKNRSGERQEPWLLIKEKDDFARPVEEFSVVDEMPDSVKALPLPADAAKQAKKAAPAKAKRGAMPEGALKADLPDELAPELATLVDRPPSSPADWVFEVKFDGYRMLARVEGKSVRLITRNGNDWTSKLLPLQKELVRMKLADGWFDGEIVVNDEQGRPNFGMLQLAFDGSNTAPIQYFIFDAPYLKGYDLRNVRLEERRALVEAELAGRESASVKFSAEFGDDPVQLLDAACKFGLEGVIGKRRDSRYVTRRSPDWIKLKCQQRQEFVIGGYTDPQGSRLGIGSLLLGYHDKDGVLQYAGNVGSGFDSATLLDLLKKLQAIETDESPFPPKAVPGRKHHWVKPKLIAEVSFSEWTNTGSVRHPVFQGLRSDKPPKRITREEAKHVEDVEPARPQGAAPVARLPATMKVTHGERVIDPSTGLTKLDMVRYYALVGELMLEHLKGRPLALVRAPAGVGGELFFQKHTDVRKLPGVVHMPEELDPGDPPMLGIVSVEGILSAAQWNVIEFHTQNAVRKSYETPDRMVFDLDPGEGVQWKTMQEAAQLMHAFLDELGLPNFLKTSGGKGLHVMVPVKGKLGWDEVKAFSQAIVHHLASTLPDRFAFKSGAKNRVGKIFIDYLRNGRGATTACAWSARTRPGLGISVPLEWDELMQVKAGDQWNVGNAHTRLDKGNEPWAGYAKAAKTLSAAMKVLGVPAK